jgi:hypothetical protein
LLTLLTVLTPLLITFQEIWVSREVIKSTVSSVSTVSRRLENSARAGELGERWDNRAENADVTPSRTMARSGWTAQ